MANEPYTITNQKLYFAKLALNEWQTLEQNIEQNSALIKVQEEATLFYLFGALWAFYNEVASFYRFPLLTSATGLTHFLTQAFIEQHPSPELNELAHLLATPESACAEIEQAWQILFTPMNPNQLSVSLIPIKNSDEISAREKLQNYLQEITALVIRLRSGLTEF